MYKKQWYCVAAYCRASNFSLNLLGSPYIWCAVTLPFQQVAPGVCLLGTLQNISEPRWPSLGGLGSPSYLTESSQNSPLSPTIHLGVAKWGEGRAPLLLLLTCQLIPALPVPFLLWVFLKCLFAFFFDPSYITEDQQSPNLLWDCIILYYLRMFLKFVQQVLSHRTSLTSV